MTLGTNASLEERLAYAFDEVDTDELLEALRELEEWRLLGDDPCDVKEQIKDLEKQVSEKEKEVEALEDQNMKLSDEVESLKDQVDDLEEEIRNLGDA